MTRSTARAAGRAGGTGAPVGDCSVSVMVNPPWRVAPELWMEPFGPGVVDGVGIWSCRPSPAGGVGDGVASVGSHGSAGRGDRPDGAVPVPPDAIDRRRRVRGGGGCGPADARGAARPRPAGATEGGPATGRTRRPRPPAPPPGGAAPAAGDGSAAATVRRPAGAGRRTGRRDRRGSWPGWRDPGARRTRTGRGVPSAKCRESRSATSFRSASDTRRWGSVTHPVRYPEPDARVGSNRWCMVAALPSRVSWWWRTLSGTARGPTAPRPPRRPCPPRG